MSARSRRGPRTWLVLAAILSLAAGSALWWLGGQLAAGSRAKVGSATDFLPVEQVYMDSASGSRLSGWYAPGRAGRGGVLLLHGSGGNRGSMLGRARFLHRRGHAVLLIDFQAHGESPGRHMTSGHLEALDAQASLGWLRRRLPGEPLAIIGFSLGGAAALLGDAARQADALVLEAVYTDIDDAIGNRLALRLGPAGRWLTPLLLSLYQPRMGFDPGLLKPVEHIAAVHTPILVIGGSEDRRSTAADTRRLFAAAGGPKELWLVDGAHHQDFHAFDPPAYEQRVGDFLNQILLPQ